jgi:hypothetical protein
MMYDVDEFIGEVLEEHGMMEESKRALLKVLDASVSPLVRELDFEELSKDLEESLSELFQKETPPPGTKIIHFGLRETAEGCSLYVVGTKKRELPEFRDSEEWDWVGPLGGELKMPALCALWESVSGGREEEWEVVLAVALIVLKYYLAENAGDFLSMINLSSVKVTAGFDEGDLYELQLEEK